MSDLHTPTNVDYLVLTWTTLVYSSRYLGLCLNFCLGHLIDTLRYLATPLLKVRVDQ